MDCPDRAMANTMPVSAIMPEAMAEKHACAELIDRPKVYDGKYSCSMLGNPNPATTLPAT
jgi:hypothetical protein